ncbi:MAG: SRPBCC domain-containing protein [Acidobacteriaceae bacterium]
MSEGTSGANSSTRSVVVEREFAHAPEKVWRALTEGDLIAQWLMENDFQPVVGHRFQLRMPPMPQWDGVIQSEVLIAEPYERLTYRWDTLGLESVVGWTLTPTEAGTLVRMEQSGFGADQEAAYKGATYGWRGFFGKLEQVVGEIQ